MAATMLDLIRLLILIASSFSYARTRILGDFRRQLRPSTIRDMHGASIIKQLYILLADHLFSGSKREPK